VSIITFSNLVTIYELGAAHSSIVSSEVYPANRCPNKEEIHELRFRRSQFLSPIENCFDNAKQILSVLSASAPLTSRGPLKGNQQRGLGAAVQFAIALLSDKRTEEGREDKERGEGKERGSQRPSATNTCASMGHIIVCTNGAPNFGPGAVVEDIKLGKWMTPRSLYFPKQQSSQNSFLTILPLLQKKESIKENTPQSFIISWESSLIVETSLSTCFVVV
jgi:hypothetical protein